MSFQTNSYTTGNHMESQAMAYLDNLTFSEDGRSIYFSEDSNTTALFKQSKNSDTYKYSLGEGNDTILCKAGDRLEIQGGPLGEISKINFIGVNNDWALQDGFNIHMVKSEDNTAISLVLFSFNSKGLNGDRIRDWGTIDLKSPNGEMIETLSIGKIELDMSYLIPQTYAVSNNYDSPADYLNTEEELLEMAAS
ncbi:MAG: hypothetical protein OQJ97_15400 [Rhodospirillales bacterium]|nr:hypothetical protein [Rhodospirillales bacterium]